MSPGWQLVTTIATLEAALASDSHTIALAPGEYVYIVHEPAAEVHAQLLEDSIQRTLGETCRRTVPAPLRR